VKTNALFQKRHKKTCEGIIHRSPLLFHIFLAAFEFHVGKTTHLLRLFNSRLMFWHFHKNGSAAQPGYVPSIGSDNQKGQYLVNTADRTSLFK